MIGVLVLYTVYTYTKLDEQYNAQEKYKDYGKMARQDTEFRGKPGVWVRVRLW
jgi:hypothetical protein